MPTRGTPGSLSILRSTAAWVVLVVLCVLTLVEYGPRTPLTYPPAPIRFVACGSLAAVVGAQVTAALGSGFITVVLARALFGRTMSSKARITAVTVVGAMLFGLSFGGALLIRHRFIGVCA